MPNKEFLEEYSLFRKLQIEVPRTLDKLPTPAINMICLDCGSSQTFNMVNSFYDNRRFMNWPSPNTTVLAKYQCQACMKFNREFHIYISPQLDYLYKFGQYPEWEIKLDRNVEITLGIHAKNYRKGLVCESQGYGIGAFAYYRRIIESIIDELLGSITELIEPENREKYLSALEASKKTRIAQEKIELTKELLPAILRPNGLNPLGVLHSELSEGLHANTDESCLESAGHIRGILTFLITQILASKQSAKEFTASMKSILEKKSGIK